jgi:hypothetical protein
VGISATNHFPILKTSFFLGASQTAKKIVEL